MTAPWKAFHILYGMTCVTLKKQPLLRKIFPEPRDRKAREAFFSAVVNSGPERFAPYKFSLPSEFTRKDQT